MAPALINRVLIGALRFQDIWLTRAACHGMRLLGRAPAPIHPKHLYDDDRNSLLRGLLAPGTAMLDIGSGTGTECITALRAGAAIACGLEKSPANLDIARRRASDAGLDPLFHACDLERAAFPFPADHFDVVNFTNVLEHLNNRQGVLAEIRRVKKPQAPVVLSAPNSETPWKRRQRAHGFDSRDDADHKIEYSEAELRAEIEGAGLEIASPLYPIIPSWPWNGALAATALLSPTLYRRAQKMKHKAAQERPETSIGWTFIAR